jgi:hypothetical protein
MKNDITVLVVQPDGAKNILTFSNALANFQAEVGGWVEAIGDGQTWTAYLNEEGKLNGLPPNPEADSIARKLGWQSLPGDYLVGPVVFCGPPDNDGYDTDLPPAVETVAL